MPAKTGNAISMQNVSLRLGTQDFAFNCDIPGGTITAVAGPSGSGKSTLFHLVAGFETAEHGSVFIGPTDVTTLHPSGRPVSTVFQDNNLFAHLNVFTNVALGISPSLKLARSDMATILEALGRVGLGDFGKRLPGTLSGGERQRAAIARALVRRRPVLLLDEPFAALDPELRHDMAQLVINLQKEEGNTVLVITHDAAEVEWLASHVLFLDNGTVVFNGSRNEFVASPLPRIGTFRGTNRSHSRLPP